MSFFSLTMDDGPHAISPCNQDSEPSTAPASAVSREADLVFRVQQALRDTHLPELAIVQVEIRYGRMHLRGSVTSWYLKQSAQSAARRVDPSMLLINLIRVIEAPSARSRNSEENGRIASSNAGTAHSPGQ